MNRTQKLLLWCAATDSTFSLKEVRGQQVLAGKCIHCNRALAVALADGAAQAATVEHILPKNHGGRDTIENLAPACSRCNSGKGVRLDARRFSDPKLQEVIARLQERRAKRRREPPEELHLPPFPGEPD